MEKSVWLDEPTYNRLVKVSGKNNRTLVGQIRFMLEKEEVKEE